MSIDFLAIISVAFLSSFGHCYSMCGGFNLLFINLNSKSNNLFLLTFIYNLFRIFAYIVLGIIFGTFGNILAINAKVQSLSFFILGIFMMILGFALIFRGNMLSFIEN
ncbi:sulfite exporter TauE/SafE family protein, partial [Campylobacter jejuni]|nr:sulfite exporter TauE/SafE family protein [Campylobacter jejuni]ECP5088923.1 sulfite exporter TauE/SafE family protein [Campylobacter jejuni]ECP8940169.1 sulfite exporter TauE/SafE family protein [Campylobacter jejuni]ELD9083454.1 sulfite exporter TauE/SafE family protein [Campylobacter jejuni]